MTIDLDALLALANAATPGPWEPDVGAAITGPDEDFDLFFARGPMISGLPYHAGTAKAAKDAAFIAAANPETVKALIERVRRAEADWKLVDDERVALEARVKAVECEARHLEREWRATQAQREKAYERLAQAEAGAAQLREALQWYADNCSAEDTMRLYRRTPGRERAVAALASTTTGSRVLERLKAADECARYLALVLGSAPDVGEPMTDRTWRLMTNAADKLIAWKSASEADRESIEPPNTDLPTGQGHGPDCICAACNFG